MKLKMGRSKRRKNEWRVVPPPRKREPKPEDVERALAMGDLAVASTRLFGVTVSLAVLRIVMRLVTFFTVLVHLGGPILFAMVMLNGVSLSDFPLHPFVPFLMRVFAYLIPLSVAAMLIGSPLILVVNGWSMFHSRDYGAGFLFVCAPLVLEVCFLLPLFLLLSS